MSENEIIQLVKMLWQATLEHKIEWKSSMLSNESGYSTSIDDCLLIFTVYFDPMVDLCVAETEFYNAEGKVFYRGHFYENEKFEVYKQIAILNDTINDQMLSITESKKKIFSRLESLLGKV